MRQAYLGLINQRGKITEEKDELEYSVAGVILRLKPGGLMTWTLWEEALAGILNYSRTKFAGTSEFQIFQKGVIGYLAEGSIRLESVV